MNARVLSTRCLRLPVVRATIRRRILVNFRVDPGVVQRLLPAPFRPKLLGGSAVAGICLIRLEDLRPKGLPFPLRWSSENAAHRIAVVWEDERGEEREGVYIARRDTGSLLNHLAGGRVFPGEHGHARFRVQEADGALELAMETEGHYADVELRARAADRLPATSHFPSLEDASRFFAAGAVGYSPRGEGVQLDGLRLCTLTWHVEPLEVESVSCSFFADPARFPPGSVVFDCALILRDIPTEWQALPDLLAARC